MAVVTHDNDHGIVCDPQFVHFIEDLANMTIQSFNILSEHRAVAGLELIAFTNQIIHVGPLLANADNSKKVVQCMVAYSFVHIVLFIKLMQKYIGKLFACLSSRNNIVE